MKIPTMDDAQDRINKGKGTILDDFIVRYEPSWDYDTKEEIDNDPEKVEWRRHFQAVVDFIEHKSIPRTVYPDGDE